MRQLDTIFGHKYFNKCYIVCAYVHIQCTQSQFVCKYFRIEIPNHVVACTNIKIYFFDLFVVKFKKMINPYWYMLCMILIFHFSLKVLHMSFFLFSFFILVLLFFDHYLAFSYFSDVWYPFAEVSVTTILWMFKWASFISVWLVFKMPKINLDYYSFKQERKSCS